MKVNIHGHLRQVAPRGYQGSCFSGSSDAVAAYEVQLTSSDETSRQMYPLTRSSGTTNWTTSNEQILVQMRRSLWGTCGCFQWCMGRLRCFSMYTVHLSINMLFSSARQQLTAYASVILNFTSVDQYPAHQDHPRSSASVLCASFVLGLRGGKCGRIELHKRDGRGRCELCRVESPCICEF